jgi:protein-disulfide isomerase
LFDEQAGENVGAYSKANLKRFAAELSLDPGSFNQCLDTKKYEDVVQQETLSGRKGGVRGTPTLFVNGQLIENGANYQVLRAAIEEALGE